MVLEMPVTSADRKCKRYSYEELSELTTYQLRTISYEEKIVSAITNTLNRENLIKTILKYRGKEESLLIKDYDSDGYNRINEIIHKYMVTLFPDEGKIKIPAKITIYYETGIQKEDMYKVIMETDIEESNVLLVNESNELCGIFNIVKDNPHERSFYLINEKMNLIAEQSANRKYSFIFFRRDDSEYIYRAYNSPKYLLPARLKYYRIPVIELEIKRLEETGTVLAIDFGTSNTTAGAYLNGNYISSPCYNDILNGRVKLNEINFVKFLDSIDKTEKWTEVFPTIVYVDNCSDTSNIKYCFGYEAVRRIKKADYINHASVFQGIKRWVNSYNKIEEIFDAHGNAAKVTRGEIIRAYIVRVIKSAESQFKCKFKNLHVTSPVKLKQQYIEMFQEIMKNDYVIEGKDALDEGIAVLYNTIADQIEKDKFIDGKEYKALIVDCGGGTTDLSSCSFKITEGNISYKVDVNTKFENGDTNFGGNNITYRIMQFMKIVFANYYKNPSHCKSWVEIDELIPLASGDIFRFVDEHGSAKMYEYFQKCYEESEKIIPTRFKEYENRAREEYLIVKNNFYFLWEIAENMKKDFFQKTSIMRNGFDSVKRSDQDSDLHITTLNKWGLTVQECCRFKHSYEFPKVVFNSKEINKLIKADIYEIVRKFLDSFYENRTLQDYSIIKLTGQSCRIDIFKEALKEFVPGKSIEFKQKRDEDDFIPDLKLSCLRGVLRYINAKKIGDVEACIKSDVPVSPYSVRAYTYNKQEKMLIWKLEQMNQVQGFISRPIGVEEIEFFLKSQDEVLRQKYIYENDFNQYSKVLAEEVYSLSDKKILQGDTDTIKNGEVRFFLFTHEKNWGFHVIPVARKDETLYIGRKKYFPFENDLSELDFFDGLK